jgi:hypothetical protein
VHAFFDCSFIAVNAKHELPHVHGKTLSIIMLSALLDMEPAAVPVELHKWVAGHHWQCSMNVQGSPQDHSGYVFK